MSRTLQLIARLCCAFGLLASTGYRLLAAEALLVQPDSIQLSSAFDGRQLLVSFQGKDVTSQAKFELVGNKIVAVHDVGYLAPLSDGQASVRITFADQTREVPIVVSGLAQPRPVDFNNEILPLLSRFGCNAGGCHGKALGQNGFKLSLFGFDSSFDYDQLVKQARGRRVFVASPEKSLLLQKAVNQIPHGGGKRFEVESEAYKLLRAWIAAGTPRSAHDSPTVTKLQIVPADRVFSPGEQQQLAVLATYSNGTVRDVTRQSSFSSNLDVVARVSENGLVNVNAQSGEAAIMARFMGQVVVFTASVPHGSPTEIPHFQPRNYIDELSLAKWKQLGIHPSPPCDDATFLRRVTLDVCGRLPTSEEVRQFLADTSADKRARKIDALLESPDYPAFFALRWSTILRNSQLAGASQASYAFHNWIKDSIARNQPYDEFVRGIVAASGEWQDAPPINWLWQNRDDQLHQTTADVAQIFLGTRLQCARCHHHPYERFSQEDYYGLSGFFTRLGRKSFGEPPPYFASPNPTTGERNPLTQQVPEPKYLDGDYAKFSPEEDPRQALVDWMRKPENPYFAPALVNRLWGHFFGRGIVHEVDDLRQTNPPVNPALLERLSRDFIDHQFDVKHIIRTMLNSQVYQLSSEPTEHNRHDHQCFARYYGRRLIAEVLHDAVDQATGNKTKFNNMALGARAVDLPNEGFGSYFLDTFDRPKRVTACECERSSAATLSQVLLLANSDDTENKLSSNEGKIAKLTQAKLPPEQMIEELYLGTFSRFPSETEKRENVTYLTAAPADKQRQALEDILWALLNSKEFVFNH